LNTSSIRIIGGRNKSYRIVFKASADLRPTSDRTKETLFSWLQFEIQNKTCLDLFAGTGGLGLEALSRGAQHVTFVERDKNLFKNIMKNIALLDYNEQAELACSDSMKWILTNKRTFDFIFLDPPFDKIKYDGLLRTIKSSALLNEGGKIYLEMNKRTEFEPSSAHEILKDKEIGDVRIMILQ